MLKHRSPSPGYGGGRPGLESSDLWLDLHITWYGVGICITPDNGAHDRNASSSGRYASVVDRLVERKANFIL